MFYMLRTFKAMQYQGVLKTIFKNAKMSLFEIEKKGFVQAGCSYTNVYCITFDMMFTT